MAYRLKLKRFDYHIQHNYFSLISSPLQAYHLGLLAADGNVQEHSGVVSLSLQERERAVVERYRDDIIPGGPIHEARGQCRVAFTSWPMMEDLARSLAIELAEPKRARKDACPFLYFISTTKQSAVYDIDQLLNASGLGMKRKHLPLQ